MAIASTDRMMLFGARTASTGANRIASVPPAIWLRRISSSGSLQVGELAVLHLAIRSQKRDDRGDRQHEAEEDQKRKSKDEHRRDVGSRYLVERVRREADQAGNDDRHEPGTRSSFACRRRGSTAGGEGRPGLKWNRSKAPTPSAAITAAVAAPGSLEGSVRPRIHQNVGTPNTIRFASEKARKTRVRTSRGARSHAATPMAR